MTKHILGMPWLETGGLSNQLIHRFFIIRSRLASVMAAMTDLLTKANCRVRKYYLEVPAARLRWTDSRTDQNILQSRAQDRFSMPMRQVDYDLPENRWIKHILRTVVGSLDQFITATETYLQQLDQSLLEAEQFEDGSVGQASRSRERSAILQGVTDYLESARKIQRAIQVLRHADWYQTVSDIPPRIVPQVLFTDPRYQTLYALYRDLRSENCALQLEHAFTYQWKHTDQLYELWCLLRLCRGLTGIGFEPTAGWLFDQVPDATGVLVPSITPGTDLRFHRGATELHLVYDGELPRDRRYTDARDLPLYSKDIHNRPDLRLDIHHEGTYIGSLICDFKYRPLRAFWDESALLTHRRPKAMTQLVSYESALRSPHLYGLPARRAERIVPIREVWALHPGGSGPSVEPDRGSHSIRCLVLHPGVGQEMLEQRLQEVIAAAVNELTEEA